MTEIKLKICPSCLGDNVTTSTIEEELPIKDGWIPVTFTLPLVHCKDCDETSYAIESRQAIHDASCTAMGVQTPGEIKDIRILYGLTAEEFSKILEMDESAVENWESRKVFPTKNNATLIKLFKKHGPTIFDNLDI